MDGDGEGDWAPVGKAAEMLRVHPETVRRYIREGLLRGRRLRAGGNRQVDLNSVRELQAAAAKPDDEQMAARDDLIRRNLIARGETPPE